MCCIVPDDTVKVKGSITMNLVEVWTCYLLLLLMSTVFVDMWTQVMQVGIQNSY